MAYALGIILDWYGPYNDFDSMRKAAREEWANEVPLIYAGISHDQYFEHVAYIGISESAKTRFYGKHKIRNPDSLLEFWLGEPVSFGKPGKKSGKHDLRIDYSESLLILACDPPLNEKKKMSLPPTCCTVSSRFFKKDWETPSDDDERPTSLPDVVTYNSYKLKLDVFGASRTISNIEKFKPLDEAVDTERK